MSTKSLKRTNTFYCMFIIAILTTVFISCSPQTYVSSGETIYRTGKNLSGQQLLDKENSSIRIFRSCQGCHGKTGDRMRNCNIKWSALTDPAKVTVPYNEALFTRFLDEDIKSDNTPARTGVHWKVTQEEKKDLIVFLKTL